jgi:hypothetical protein
MIIQVEKISQVLFIIVWVSQAKKTTRVIFPLKKHTSAVFCLSHDTKWEHFYSNRRKF